MTLFTYENIQVTKAQLVLTNTVFPPLLYSDLRSFVIGPHWPVVVRRGF